MRTLLLTLGLAIATWPLPAATAEPTDDASDERAEGAEDAEESGDPLDLYKLGPDEDTTVRAIEIHGLRRVDRTSVRSKIYTQIGRPLSRSRVSDDLKRIYRMNFFEDVQVAVKPDPNGGIVLIYRVFERPTVMSIDYDVQGDSVDLEEIKKVVDLKRFAILDEAAIQRNLSKIDDLYVEEGHFLVETRYTLQEVGNNGVNVTLHVEEGKKVEVRHIHLVGNKSIPSEEIKAVLQTREGGYFSFLTQSGQFKREHFEQDLQRIQYFYLTKGYVQVQVEDPIVTLSPDKRSLSITIRIDEGPQYTVSAVDVEMIDDDWLIPKEKLLKRIKLEPGEIFDYQELQGDLQRLGDAFRDKGYANATVSHRHDLDPDARKVGFTYTIQKGELVYFRRISIRGNRTTRDKVIRRQMKVAEGELYNASKLRRSQQRINVLGFFDSVEIEPRPTNQPDLMDVVVNVKEKQTGTFQVGAGFSSLESFIVTAQVSKENFLGRGQTLSAQMTLSSLRQLFSISFFEPYFFDTRWTFAFDLFNFQENFNYFARDRMGGTLSWGYRLTDDLSASLTYTLEDVSTSGLGISGIQLKNLPREGLTSSLRATLAYDTRDNRLFPTDGQYSTLSAEHAPKWLGSEFEFTRLLARTRWYFPLFWDLVFKVNATAGWVFSTDNEQVPLFERFFVGGIFTCRGFDRNSIGEEVRVANDPDSDMRRVILGGDKEIITNSEIEFPIFAEVGIKGVFFFDACNAWGPRESIDPLHLRTSAGLGFRWHSPVGPLRFEWGFPLKPRPGEDRMLFEFTIGNSF